MRLDGIEPLLNLGAFDRGTQHPGAQQALAHRRKGRIHAAEKRDLVAGVGEQRLDQLQVAHGDGVEHQAVLTLVEADAVHVFKRPALGGADIVQDGAGCGGRRRTVRQAKAFERKHAEMVLDQRDGVVGREHPVVERRLG